MNLAEAVRRHLAQQWAAAAHGRSLVAADLLTIAGAAMARAGTWHPSDR